MKNIIIIAFIFLFIQVQGFSQRPTGVVPKGGAGNLNMGRYYGKIVDANKKGIDGATLQIKGNKFDTVNKKMIEGILGTQLSAANGDFSFENLPVMGNLKLTITNIGYKKIEKTLNFNIKMGAGQNMQELMAAVDKDLGNIKLEESATDLQSVTVTSTARPQFEMGIDRKIFNVDKNILSSGQTAVEVMKSIPNLNVDIDGNVTLRNATPTLLIDNRPTTLTMDQIPADIIDKVEIITNPSAKYDASGGNAGILNIVLKKNKKNGYNGGIRTGIDMRGKFSGGGDLNVRDNKLNFSASANMNGRKSVNTNTTVRDILGGPLPTQVTTINNSNGNGAFNFYRAGMDYLPDNRNSFSLYGNLMQGNMGSSGNQSIDSVKAGIHNQSPYQLTNSNYFDFLNKGAQIGFKHLFTEKGHELTSDFNYNESNSNSWSKINSSFLNQRSNGVGNSKNYTTNLDYAREMTDDLKFETGMRYNLRDDYNSRDQFRNDIFIGSISNKYKYGESIMAEYVNLSGKKDRLSYQLGLRAESRTFTVDVQNHDGMDSLNFKTSLPISLFPSAFVTYKLNDKNDIQINYSKRINAPNFFQLQPFPDYSDPLNITVGNPALKPQFTHSIELNYNNAYKKGSNLLASIYYKYSTDLITNYIYKAINPTTNDSAYYSSYINANTAVTYGLELSNKTTITKWWDMNLSFNLFNSSIQATIPGQNVNNNLTSWFSKMNNTFKMPKGYSFQFSGQYQAKTILPPGGGSSSAGGRGGMGGGGGGGFGGPQSTAQGYNFAFYDFDMALKKDWTLSGGRTASLSLSVSDVFKTRINKTYSESQYFIQNLTRIRDQQFFRLNFSYRFGKFDLNLLKRKNNKSEEGGGMDQMQQ